MDQARRWVIKYFSCLLGNDVDMWSNLDHAVVTAAIRQWRLMLLLGLPYSRFEYRNRTLSTVSDASNERRAVMVDPEALNERSLAALHAGIANSCLVNVGNRPGNI